VECLQRNPLEAKQEFPSIGTAIGLGRLLLLIEKIQDKLLIPQQPTLHLILPMSKDQHILSLLLANELQSNKLCTDILLQGSMKSMMRKANKMGAKFVLILGEDEQKTENVTIKNMLTGKSETIKQTNVVNFLKNKKA